MAKNRILVIDDETANVDLLKTLISAHGHEVLVAYDGLEGLRIARNDHPDSIVLDLMIPKLDGYKVCRMLKFDKKYSMIPIIICSAKDQDEDKRRGREVGADAYITKPFDPSVLVDTITGLIENK